MIDIRVTYADGNTTDTGFNGTMEEAKAYFIGKKFNFGDNYLGAPDRLIEAIAVDEIKS